MRESGGEFNGTRLGKALGLGDTDVLAAFRLEDDITHGLMQ